jgi:hypothetical protein
MGLNLNYILYLQRNGHLSADKNVLLDLGPQNVWYASPEQISEIVRNQGRPQPPRTVVDTLALRSTPSLGRSQTFFAEVADLAGIEYRALDVCPAPSTDIVDLNVESLPDEHVGRYDVVLNFGTTEHIFNQFNSFKVLHEATKVGGVIYCQLPATGYFEHGYFCYTPLFFRTIAADNQYEIVDTFFTMAGRSNLKDLAIEMRSVDDLYRSREIDDAETSFAYFNFHVLLRRCSAAPFRVGLKIATAAAAVNSSLLAGYGDAALLKELERMESSLSWKGTAPLRFVTRVANLVGSGIRRFV